MDLSKKEKWRKIRIGVSILGVVSIGLLGTICGQQIRAKNKYQEQVIIYEDLLQKELNQSLKNAYLSNESTFLSSIVTDKFIEELTNKLALFSQTPETEKLESVLKDIAFKYELSTAVNGFFETDLLVEDKIDYSVRLLESASLEELMAVENHLEKVKQEGDAFYIVIKTALAASKKLIQARDESGQVMIDAPLISQLPELPTGCEITAITMMLQYTGVKKDKIQLANEMLRHESNPNLGYVGNPFAKTGWTVHPQGVLALIETNAGSSQDLTGVTLQEIENRLAKGTPVVTWMTMHGFTVHAITLVGFDSEYIFYHDPWTGEANLKMTKDTFMKNWSSQEFRAVSI